MLKLPQSLHALNVLPPLHPAPRKKFRIRIFFFFALNPATVILIYISIQLSTHLYIVLIYISIHPFYLSIYISIYLSVLFYISIQLSVILILIFLIYRFVLYIYPTIQPSILFYISNYVSFWYIHASIVLFYISITCHLDLYTVSSNYLSNHNFVLFIYPTVILICISTQLYIHTSIVSIYVSIQLFTHSSILFYISIQLQWGKKIFDLLLILYICPLTKKWSVYNFNRKFIWTVRARITTTNPEKRISKKLYIDLHFN